jgi:hypothetical protein
MEPIKFSDYKQKIIEALNKKGASLGVNEPVTLVDGFINQPIQNEISGSFVIGGPTIPMIMIVGKSSGRIYLFALKALLPDEKI